MDDGIKRIKRTKKESNKNLSTFFKQFGQNEDKQALEEDCKSSQGNANRKWDISGSDDSSE